MIRPNNNTDSMHTIERAVYMIIAACLNVSTSESIEISPKYFDFFLPKGAHKLGWPNNTYVEVKYRFAYNSISRIRHLYDSIKPNKLVVIVIEEDNIPPYTSYSLSMMVGRNIDILSLNQLQNKIEKNPSQKKSSRKADIADLETTYQENQDANLLKKARIALQNNKVSVFLGAGVSASAGVATWESLLEQLCVKKGLSKIDSDIDSIIKGRYIIEEYKKSQKQPPEEFYQDIRDILYANKKSSDLISSIASLITRDNIESIISYNYDNLVEQEVMKQGKKCIPIFDKTMTIEQSALCIYHVHGYVSHEENLETDNGHSPIVLGEQEYHKIFQESYNWGNVEQLHALCRSTCLFIGLSMNDPNLRRLIDISIEGSEVEPMHYAFLRRIEYNVPFMEKIMRGFGINCIWYDKYEELPNIINNLMLE